MGEFTTPLSQEMLLCRSAGVAGVSVQEEREEDDSIGEKVVRIKPTDGKDDIEETLLGHVVGCPWVCDECLEVCTCLLQTS